MTARYRVAGVTVHNNASDAKAGVLCNTRPTGQQAEAGNQHIFHGFTSSIGIASISIEVGLPEVTLTSRVHVV